jgi:pyruvate carboxylase subunit B
MPGGALTANTQMMRDNNCLNLYPQVIKEMQEVVERGGFGTSVTPVSQFYFQQAFANVTQGKWEKITDGYGKMVLGYFGHTPAEPDSEIVNLAAEQLKLEPTKADVHDINDDNPELGIDVASAKLSEAGLEITDENVMIAATCGDKGIEFLKGNKPLGIRYVEDEKPAASTAVTAAPSGSSKGPESYSVTVNGKSYDVHVAPGGATSVAPTQAAATPAAAPAGSGASVDIKAPMPGTVLKVLVEVGDTVAAGDAVVVIEAMKMETELKAQDAGTVTAVNVQQGATVASDEVLVSLG